MFHLKWCIFSVINKAHSPLRFLDTSNNKKIAKHSRSTNECHRNNINWMKKSDEYGASSYTLYGLFSMRVSDTYCYDVSHRFFPLFWCTCHASAHRSRYRIAKIKTSKRINVNKQRGIKTHKATWDILIIRVM